MKEWNESLISYPDSIREQINIEDKNKLITIDLDTGN